MNCKSTVVLSEPPGIVHVSADTPPSSPGLATTTTADWVFGTPQADGSLGRLGHYQVLKRLGSGGMGVVYLARDEGLDRQVALKVLLPSATADPSARQRFLREARAAAAVKHPSVVTIYQVGEDRGVPYLAMEFLQGMSLERYLARKGQLTISQVVRVGIETARGLAAAHALGLIHRDIKPGNLWLEGTKGRVRILDFGIARRVKNDPDGGLTGTGLVLGTPNYMSPEQAMAKPLDYRSDLFSLGVVLYQLATGRLPFQGETAVGVMAALALEEPPPVRSLNPDIPAELEAIIHQLLEKEPEARPPSAAVVAEELRALQSGVAVPLATPVAVAVPAPRVVPAPIPVPVGTAVTAAEPAEGNDFEGFGDNIDNPENRANPGPGWGLWAIAVAVLLLVGVVVAGAVSSLRTSTRSTREASADRHARMMPIEVEFVGKAKGRLE